MEGEEEWVGGGPWKVDSKGVLDVVHQRRRVSQAKKERKKIAGRELREARDAHSLLTTGDLRAR